MKTFYSYSFGCRVNEAEKEEIDRKMSLNGFVFDFEKPDIFIINTCSVTHKAEREARQLIYQTKKKLPEAKIVITGCSTTYWMKHNLHKKLPVDMVVDNVNKEYLVKLIKKRLSHQPIFDRSGRKNMVTTNKFIGSGRVMVKIQDGCQRYCTFCIVPYLRGIPQSEKINDLILKIKNFGNNVKEVILTAINTQAFGYDTNESLIDLLKMTINSTSIPRISLGSVHPWSLTDEFLDFYQTYLHKNKLVNFFHIPLQSGSNKILTLMKRGYKREELKEKLERLQSLNPFALVATDIIVGFLEEIDTDFDETYSFLEKSPINKFHVFRFSKRKRTQADYMARRLNEPTPREKEKRAQALIELSKEKYAAFMKKNIGRTSSVLFLEKSIEGYREGLLDNQLSVFVPISPRRWKKAGEITNVKVIEFKKGKLFGKID